ncbi:hypothetical protein NDU88_005944 [Pleurodeles waltl]|uniref:Uncharacterized protein n=1 Tax=Pleurodeles waltl TaxID=8319 RepID=A0AAV7LQH7_PLEWA|nr:hypothetical protein NDU88_005944 [Pleurodeles waltl]
MECLGGWLTAQDGDRLIAGLLTRARYAIESVDNRDTSASLQAAAEGRNGRGSWGADPIGRSYHPDVLEKARDGRGLGLMAAGSGRSEADLCAAEAEDACR